MSQEEGPPRASPDGRVPWADRKALWTIRSAEWLGKHLPRAMGLRLAEAYQWVAFGRGADQRQIVAGNLSRVLGQPPDSPLVQTATRECFLLYGRYWYETFALRTMPWEEVDRRFTVDGFEHIQNAVAAGHGFIAALPHMGNWDAAGHWLSMQGVKMTAVAEELRPPAVFELFLRHRRALGMSIVPLVRGRNVGEELVHRLRDNEVITLVADRDLSGKGVDVEMFGAPRKLPAGPAYLSLATGVPLSVAAVFTTQEGWHCRIDPPLQIERTGGMRQDVTTLTRLIGESFERFISAAPTDWHMFQPAWGEDGSPTSPDAPIAP
jgi:phosphatidylinositol dimannoside acyltransferase